MIAGYICIIFIPVLAFGFWLYNTSYQSLAEQYMRGKQQVLEQSYGNLKVQLAQMEAAYGLFQYNGNVTEYLSGAHTSALAAMGEGGLSDDLWNQELYVEELDLNLIIADSGSELFADIRKKKNTSVIVIALLLLVLSYLYYMFASFVTRRTETANERRSGIGGSVSFRGRLGVMECSRENRHVLRRELWD